MHDVKSNVAESNAEPVACAGTHRVHITRVLNAPRAMVFKAWTDPEQLARWFYLDALTTRHVEADVRPGGKWNLEFVAPDGLEITVQRVYREIVADERIVFYELCRAGNAVMLDGVHTVIFSDEDQGEKKGTRIDITCDLAKPFDTQNHQGWNAGWNEILARLNSQLPPA